MSGLFSTFNIARSGLTTQQKAIDVTSHNISNSATVGYSRQRAIIKANRATNTIGAGQIGTGASVVAIERVRDNFLDYQVRNENSSYGQAGVKSDFLYEIESIFNEPSDTGISSLLNKFFDAFQELSKQPNSSNARTIVVQQTESLCNMLNSTYTKLEDLKGNAESAIKSGVSDVNSMLTQLDSLNQEIIKVTVSGNTPNDLMDSRDLLLDELSKKINIKVEKKEFNGIEVYPQDGSGVKGLALVTTGGLNKQAKFSYISSIKPVKEDYTGKTYELTYYVNGDTTSEDNKRTVTVTGLTDERVKELETTRIIWGNENGEMIRSDGSVVRDKSTITASEFMSYKPSSGELSGSMSINEDIERYMSSLDKLAKSIAFSVNAIHSGMEDPLRGYGEPALDYVPFFVNSDAANYDRFNTLSNIEGTLNSESEISAKNISVNKEILADVMKIKTKKSDHLFDYTTNNTIDGEGDGTRALSIAGLKNTLLSIQYLNETAMSRKEFFDYSKTGNILSSDGLTISASKDGMTINSFFNDMVDKLGVEAQEADRAVTNQAELLDSLELSRMSVSGVSLDEEMVNLMQFQHAYSASAKVVSTVDELLDVIINGLKK